jgi:beta-glucanase (GH16 family)
MKNLNFILLSGLMIVNLACNKPLTNSHIKELERKGWNLVWVDEFNKSGLPDTNNWSYDTGGNGWGNHELQYYTLGRLENARVEDGKLIIETKREPWKEKEYTSARLTTRMKEEWLYGRFEVRAKLPFGLGTWPAIWMLPSRPAYGSGHWPDNGEIDIMEHVGYDQGLIHGSTHCKAHYWRIGTQRSDSIRIPDASTAFHDYSIEWDSEKIQMFVDDSLYFTSPNDKTGWEVWPFDKPFIMLLNIAVGGDWGGVKGVDTTIWPQRMEVDYVRVYQKKNQVSQ